MRAGLLDTVAYLPPFRLDEAGRLTLAEVAGRAVHPAEAVLDGGSGPHPVAADVGLAPLATTVVPLAANAAAFENTDQPLHARCYGHAVEKLSWCPRTGECLFVSPPQQHRTAPGSHPFADYVRLIVLPSHRLVLTRPCVPTWSSVHGPQLTLEGARLSTVLQVQAWRVFVAGQAGWSLELNTHNRRLEALTGRRGW